MRKLLFLIIVITASFSCAFATHNRAGYVTFKHLSGLQYQITVTTFTKTSAPADRPSFGVSWGDSTSDTIPRTQIIFNVGPDTQENTYVGNHTFPGPSQYTISLLDPNRNANVINIPNSVNIPFYIETVLTINPMFGNDNSPQITNRPLGHGIVGQIFTYNPNAYDADGDSLAYKLVPCKGDSGSDIPGYTYPKASTSFTLDQITGDLVWSTPTALFPYGIPGEYNVAMLIEEYRRGTLIGNVRVDMQIDIDTSNDHPPIIDSLANYCVLAGDSVNFNVTAHDPDNDWLTLTSNGGPYNMPISPAGFTNISVPTPGPLMGTFTWITDCSHVRKLPYNVLFKAEDDHPHTPPPDISLSVFKTAQITVVAPAPKNLTATKAGNNILLNWNSSCQQIRGYKVYRKDNLFIGTIPCPCTTGVPPSTGYSLIATLPDKQDTSYVDDNNGKGLVHGVEYCYIVIAFFDDGAESCASNQSCQKLKKDLPVITNVSVLKTDMSKGQMYVAWSKPNELDTIQFPPPYKYVVYHSFDFQGNNLSFVDTMKSIDDTLFVDTLINTFSGPVSYRIGFYSGNNFVGNSNTSSSVFQLITAMDHALYLSWNEDVSWTNSKYVVYKFNSAKNRFDSIGVTTKQFYIDSNLANGRQQCYKIKSIGGYSISGFVNPIINYSEELCAIPIDTIPPCPPILKVTPDCMLHQNFIEWTNQNNLCDEDVVGYKIYFRPTITGDFALLQSFTSNTIKSYLHSNLAHSIAGCYALTAIDSAGNESRFANQVCVDNSDSCIVYKLPNVFTPNGDDVNDYFHPFPFSYIKDVDMKIYDRWGLLIYNTSNPDILWDGKNQSTKKDCPEGVYYYICKVHVIHLSGSNAGPVLKGPVQLIRGK